MKKIFFVTTNSQKFKEVKEAIEELDQSIVLEQAILDIPECQTLDILEVAIEKAKTAWSIVKKPLMVDDGGIFIEQYNNFPGALSKYVFQGIGLEGIWKLAQDNPNAYFSSYIVYIDSQNSFKSFIGTTSGTIVKPENKAKNLEMPYTEIFIPKGSKEIFSKIKQTPEAKKYNHRTKAIKELVNWLKKNN